MVRDQPALWRRESITIEALSGLVGMIGATTCHHVDFDGVRIGMHSLPHSKFLLF